MDKPGLVAVDPLQRPDWDSLLASFPERSIFHGSGWARVLRDTYGHRPFYFAQFKGERLAAVLPVMEVSSWLTGRRGVSLPFTDFCGALKSETGGGAALFETAINRGRERQWKYLECRARDAAWDGSLTSLEFYGHVIDLGAGVERLFQLLGPAMRRGVRKAEGAGIKVEFGTGLDSIRTFYALHCRTRQRHGLPPQPFRLFENIQRHILGAGQGFVAVARLENRPLAAGVFFSQGGQAIYKFGASDYRAQNLRPNNLMMWGAMRRCAEQGMTRLNLGRTSLSNEGLRRFKLGFGAEEEKWQYAKYDFASKQFIKDIDRVQGWFNGVFGRLPLPLLRLAGCVLYPHLS
jgi:hypothetical protein